MGDEIAVAGIKKVHFRQYDKRIGHATQVGDWEKQEE